MKGTSLKYLTHEGFRNVWVNRLMSLASVTVLMACLIIMGAGIMIYFNINNVVDKVQSQNVVMVYVADDATEDETTQIGTSLKGISNVESCEFVPKEVAFQEQIQSMGGDAALFEGFDEIPLPDAYKVTVKDLSQFENTVSQIKQINKVDSVRENSDLASKLLSLRHAVSIVSVGLVVMLFLVALFIISNTIRITMFSRKLEISIMKAVGATNWFIRWPFMIEGMILGTISGIVSLGVLWGLYAVAEKVFAQTLSLIGFSLVPFSEYWWQILLVFVAIGLFTGGFGSLVSMAKYLKEQGSVVSDD
ncbi:MAG: ABC transporter permease [Ruminococcaceae bacterium]|uniref:permease-like cell division protein FtsX n=1 Tax=Candidatus Fimenecus sp. TaxID=3022888 RepID=UPI001ACFF371|nr:ABC transporter permease [Oscillospiraceae bacterium]